MNDKRKLKVLQKENEKLVDEIIYLKKQLRLYEMNNELNDRLKTVVQENIKLYKQLKEYRNQYQDLIVKYKKGIKKHN